MCNSFSILRRKECILVSCMASNSVAAEERFCLASARRGQESKQCSKVCTEVLHKHKRSSRGILGYVNLPFSICRLWFPVRYLVRRIRSVSNETLYIGEMRSGLTLLYAPSLESGSMDALLIWVVHFSRYSDFNVSMQFSGEVYFSLSFI